MTQGNENRENTLRDTDLEAINGAGDHALAVDIDSKDKWYKNFLKMRRKAQTDA